VFIDQFIIYHTGT